MEQSGSGIGGRVSVGDTLGGEDSDEDDGSTLWCSDKEEVFLSDMWREAHRVVSLAHSFLVASSSGSDGLSHALRKGFFLPTVSSPLDVAFGVSATVPDDAMDNWGHNCSRYGCGMIDGEEEDELLLSPVVGSSPKAIAAVSVPETSLWNGSDASLHPTPSSPFVLCVEATSLAVAPVQALGDSAFDLFDSSVNGSRVNGFEGLPGHGTASPTYAMVEDKFFVYDSLLVKTIQLYEMPLCIKSLAGSRFQIWSDILDLEKLLNLIYFS
ncbi:hypothetical protein SUGI_0016180 [Cryptomeria japonica]|nr:hypothetical protein SUGI_0016180 [Cryptomeria japonica]